MRARGYRPSLEEGTTDWAAACAAVPEGDPSAVVILGSSRALAGLNLEELAAGISPLGPVVQLAVSGGGVEVPVLRYLNDALDFRGVVLLDLIPRQDIDQDLARAYLASLDEFLVSPSRRIEFRLGRLLRQSFVFRLPLLRPDRVLRGALRDHWPEQVVRVDGARNRFMNFADHPEDLAERLRRREERWGDGAGELEAELSPERDTELTRLIADLRARGAEVVLVRMPYGPPVLDGDLDRVEGRTPPPDDAWSELCARTGAPAIHFADHAALRGFECPDHSHLDERDARAFTREFARILAPLLATRRGARAGD